METAEPQLSAPWRTLLTVLGVGLAVLALLLGALSAHPAYGSATVFGSNPTELHQRFGAALTDHLVKEKGIEATYHALWGMSSFRYYCH